MNTTESTAKSLTVKLLDQWIEDQSDVVALHLKQKLVPVEGEGGVIFPPTYADIGYNIDTLSDGTKVATIDSVGSQANRMEPLFKRPEYAALVPRIEIILSAAKKNGVQIERRQSLLDLAHRSADAVVKATPELERLITPAFEELHRHGNAGPLCAIAPTSLLFGVWDSRGGTGEKRPRLIRSIIRAWDVEPLYSAAQFNSIRKVLEEDEWEALEKEAKSNKTKLSEKGFDDAPAVFRKVSQSAAKHMTEFRNGAPNPERRTLGGVIARGAIERDVTINLVALRSICGTLAGGNGKPAISAEELRRYLLSLALLAGTNDQDLFLREGCLLRYADVDTWHSVPRRGAEQAVDLASEDSKRTLFAYARKQAELISHYWPDSESEYRFDIKEAKKIIAKRDINEEQPAS
jgi:CRISPR-associated protein Csb1